VVIKLLEEDIGIIHKEMTFMENHLKGAQTLLSKCIRRWRQKRFDVKVSQVNQEDFFFTYLVYCFLHSFTKNILLFYFYTPLLLSSHQPNVSLLCPYTEL